MATLRAESKSETMPVTPKEKGLLLTLRNIKYGRGMLYIENGEPVRMEQAIENIKF